MTKASTPLQKPHLTALTLWIMTIATGLVVANIYYNQPLLGDIAHTFHINKGTAGHISMITQLGYAAGMFFIVPLADMFERKKLIMLAFIAVIFALLAVAMAPDINLL